MSPLRRSSERSAGRGRRDALVRGVATAGAWLVILLLALPLLDLVRRAGAGLEWATFVAADSISAARRGHERLDPDVAVRAAAPGPGRGAAGPRGRRLYRGIAPRGRGAMLVDRSIRHLAMLPPVVFGLLGFGGLVVVLRLPVGTPLLAGAVLALAMLPRIVLAGQVALRRVTPSVREAGFAMGASPLQVVAAHVLPHAAPSMLGAAFSMLARALGEAAPLLLVGFFAFAAGRPASLTEPGIPLPLLAFRWGGLPDPLFAAKAAVAALVLVVAAALLGLAGYLLERRGRAA
jgi:ABC-type spermidine/putrescine transport system permease subunit II